MKFAWIEDGRIRDVCLGGDPAECYHFDVAKFYDTEVPDDAVNGDGWVNGQLVKPVAPAPVDVPPPPRTWSVNDVRGKLSLAERVKWDNDSLPEIKTAKLELATPQEIATTTEVLDMLVACGAISQTSADKILE